jgi:predicted metal-dependent hydrolase
MFWCSGEKTFIFRVVVRKRIKRSEESSKLISSSVNKSVNSSDNIKTLQNFIYKHTAVLKNVQGEFEGHQVSTNWMSKTLHLNKQPTNRL